MTTAVVGLCVLTASAATAAVLHVAEDGSADFATIQEAVDAAGPFDTIVVAPGEYAGAVIDIPLTIEGSGNATVIDAGDPMFGVVGFLICGQRGINCQGRGGGTRIQDLSIGGLRYGVFGDDVDGVEVHDLTIANVGGAVVGIEGDNWSVSHLTITDVSPLADTYLYGAVVGLWGDDWSVSHLTISEAAIGVRHWFGQGWWIGDLKLENVYWGVETFLASGLTVTRVDVTGTNHGIEIWFGSGCVITDNNIRDLTFPFHANGIIAGGDDCLVADNRIFHQGEQVCVDSPESPCELGDDEFYTGINVLPGTRNNLVVDNNVTIAVSDPDPVGDGRVSSFALVIQSPDNAFLDNKLTGLGTDGVCPIEVWNEVPPDPFYAAGCVVRAPEVQLCSAPSTPPGCTVFEDNKLEVF